MQFKCAILPPIIEHWSVDGNRQRLLSSLKANAGYVAGKRLQNKETFESPCFIFLLTQVLCTVPFMPHNLVMMNSIFFIIRGKQFRALNTGVDWLSHSYELH